MDCRLLLPLLVVTLLLAGNSKLHTLASQQQLLMRSQVVMLSSSSNLHTFTNPSHQHRSTVRFRFQQEHRLLSRLTAPHNLAIPSRRQSAPSPRLEPLISSKLLRNSNNSIAMRRPLANLP